MNRRLIACALPAVAALLVAGAARAEKADRDQEMSIKADRFEGVDDKVKVRQEVVAVGNVVITQGTLKVTADRATVIEENGRNRAGEATGGPVSFRQKRDDGNGYNEGVADRLEFDERTSDIRFYSNVKFKIGKNAVSGEYATYNSETEAYTASNALPGKGSVARGQVEMILQPTKRDADSKPAAKKEK